MAKSEIGTYAEEFGEKFQRHILAVMLRIPGVVVRYRSALDHQYFTSDVHRLIAKYLLQQVDEYRFLPTESTLIELIRPHTDEDTLAHVEKMVAKLYKDNVTDHAVVTKKIVEFGKMQAMVNATVANAEDLEKGDRSKILGRVQEAMLVGEDVLDIGTDYLGTLPERADWYTPHTLDHDVIPTGIYHLDAALGGGLGRGELGVVIAPPKRGKSLLLVNIGFGALFSTLGFNVVHYSFEIVESTQSTKPHKVSKRYDDRLAGKYVRTKKEDPDKYAAILQQRSKKFINGRLFVKSYPTRTASVSTLRNHISLLISRGFTPDLIIADYGDIMRPERRIGEMRHEQAGIYEDLRALAGEFDAAVWTASQTNRVALDKEVITLGDFSEAFEKAAIIDAGVAFCVYGGQSVLTDKGSIPMWTLVPRVEAGEKIKVLSHNFRTGKDEWRQILRGYRNGKSEVPFLRIKTEVTGRSKGSITTPEHRYFAADGSEVRAQDLKEGDEILGRAYVLSQDQEQVLLGSLLGDGYISPEGSLRFTHGAGQQSYLRWKLSVFSDLPGGVSRREQSDKWGTRVAYHGRIGRCLAFQRERSRWYLPKGKSIPAGALDALTDLGLAIWFMDDASIQKKYKRVRLYYQGFDQVSRQQCVDWFVAQGWYGTENRCTFQFDAESSRDILARIGRYLSYSDEARETKVWTGAETTAGGECVTPVRVTSIEPFEPKNTNRYDIEVAYNHNFYLASGVLVHNCMTEDERIDGKCRLFLAGLRNEEDGRTVECNLMRTRAYIESTALLDAGYNRIGEDDEEEPIVETKVTTKKASADLKASVGIKKPVKRKAYKRPKKLGKKAPKHKKPKKPSKKVDLS